MKKKIIAFIFCFLMLTCSTATLSACNNASNDPNNSSTEQSQGGGDNSNSTEKGNTDDSSNTDDSGNMEESEDTNGDGDTTNNNPSPDETATDGLFTYTLNEDKNSYTVSIFSRDIVSKYDSEEEFFADYEDILSRKEITIPSEYKGTPVTAIGEFAFVYMGIESIALPDPVTTIGMGAFRGCIQLKSIDFSSNLETIGYGAFASCYKLTKVVLPEGLTTIEDEAFYSCPGLISITLPSTLTAIGDDEYGHSVFYNCKKLIEIINHSNIDIADFIKYTSHSNSEALEIHNAESKLVESGDYLFYTTTGKNWLMAYTGDDVNITLPGSYNGRNYYVHSYAFFELNDKLLSITMENDSRAAIALSDNAFAYCRVLQDAHISANVMVIGEGVFEGCEKLMNLSVDSGNEIYSSNGNCLVLIDRKILLAGCGNSVIPTDGSVEEIYSNSFYRLTTLEDVVIPKSVQKIGSNAFNGCTSLKSVVFEENSELTEIDYSAFSGCSSLETLVLPDKIIEIDDSAFSGCDKLITTYSNAEYLRNGDNAYYLLLGITDYDITSCEIHPNTGLICAGAFSACQELKSLTIPQSVKFIGEGAIYGCVSLEYLVIPFVSDDYKDEDSYYGGPSSYLGYLFGEGTIKGDLNDWGDTPIPLSLKKVVVASSTEDNWKLFISDENGFDLTGSNYYLYSNVNTNDGKTWHYVDGVPTLWGIGVVEI